MLVSFPSHISDLDKRGFIHIYGFLNEYEIAQLQQDFEKAEPLDNSNYSVRSVSAKMLSTLEIKLKSLAEQISEKTQTNIDTLSMGIYFSNWKADDCTDSILPQRFPWHVDNESYYVLQDHTDYLNFYIPIFKPIPEKSNLSLLPADHLAQCARDVSENLKGRGAARIITDKKGNTVVIDDEDGGLLGRIDFPLSDIEETPHLRAGDLLLLRGDVVHRTQDVSTQRTAVSLRMYNSHRTISRKRLVSGGVVKTTMMVNNWKVYERLLRHFDVCDSDVVTALPVEPKVELPPNAKKRDFILRLIWEKILAGNILAFLLDFRNLSLMTRNLVD